MWFLVVREFHNWDKSGPLFWVVCTDSKVCFYFLIWLFGCTIFWGWYAVLMVSSIPRRHPISLKTFEANWGPLSDMPIFDRHSEWGVLQFLWHRWFYDKGIKLPPSKAHCLPWPWESWNCQRLVNWSWNHKKSGQRGILLLSLWWASKGGLSGVSLSWPASRLCSH